MFCFVFPLGSLPLPEYALNRLNTTVSHPGRQLLSSAQIPQPLLQLGQEDAFKERPGWWGQASSPPLTPIRVSVTQLSHRLFLEFTFYNPHTVIPAAPGAQTLTLLSAPLPREKIRCPPEEGRLARALKAAPGNSTLLTLSALARALEGDDNFQADRGSGRV